MDRVRKTIETYEKIAEEYAEEHSHDIDLIREQIEFFARNMRGKMVLDVGCGPGRDAKYFTGYGFEVTGIDLTPKFIRIASARVTDAKFFLMDMRKLDFPDSSFDGIWASGSFQHLPKGEAKSALVEFNRVLRPGGLVYVSVKEGVGEKEVRKESYKGGSKLFSFYGENELRNLFLSSGFSILKIFVREDKDTWVNLFAVKER